MKKFWEGLLKYSWGVIGVFVLVTGFMVLGATKIKQDTSAEAMNPDNNAIVELNARIDEDFNAGRMEILVLHAENVFTPGHLNEVRAITAELEGLEGVKKVTSLTNSSKMLEQDGVLITSDMVPEDNPSEADIAAIRQYLDSNYLLKSGLLAAKDGTSTNVMVEFLDSVDMPRLAAEMEAPLKNLWTGTYDMTGIPTMESSMLKMVQRDLPLLGALALLIILGMFLLNYRSLLGAWMPLLQIVVGLIWGAGAFGWIGLKFQALTIIGPIAVLAVGSSFTLHLLGRYFLELSHGTEKRTAIVNVLQHTGLGVLISGLAISASMLTFLLSDLQMVRGLGTLTALGVGASMLSSLTLLPALLSILPAPKVRVKLEGTGWMGGLLRSLGHFAGHHSKGILATGALLVVVAAFGIFQIVPNTSVIAFFRPDSTFVKGNEVVNKVLGGSTSVRMVVTGDLQDPALLKALLQFQEEIQEFPEVGPTTSLASLMRSLHQTLTGEEGLPGSRELVAQELLVYQSSGSVDDITSLVDLNYTQGLVTILAPRLSTHETQVLFDKLRAKSAELIGDKAKIEFAGDILTETALEQVLLHDFVLSLSLALLLVICIDSLIRSVRAALVTILVLAVTIVLQYGFLGLLGLPFNLATALMGALAIGVGDYAIHLTVRYIEDRRRGLSPEDAIVETLATSGRSIVFTALTIGGGFIVLGFSDFMPVATLGSLMVLTVLIVGVATLTLLPAACVRFLRNPVKLLEVKNHA